MLYRFSLFASSLLATLPLTTFAQTTPVAAAPQAVTVMTGPVGNAGNGAAATPVPAAPLSVTSSLVASAGVAPAVGGANVSTSAAPAAAASTAGVIGNGQVAVWVVKVGGTKNELVFSPNSVTAKVGEMVQFQFYSKNHSVAAGDFASPCTPQQSASNAFYSGFMPTDKEGQLTYTIPIRDTNPIWFYCSQGKHCQEGMVGVINPPATGQTLADFASRAAQAPANVSPKMPGAAAPAAGGEGQLGGTTATPASTDPAAAPAATATTSAAGKVVRSSWALSLIVVAALFVIQG
ncbi:hypothetical protein EG328_010135 [Venturia inaequalis]|uniref:Phytocyanin domain-containing protein n=1 Tax=Venturia inaequalis TaxID=5025 RepID=A0A8H3U7I6_VENIN|nr:hypothetical protein EG328_010135 [Venturia inaequalis]